MRSTLKNTAMSYAAMPDAIPTTQWLVVPCDASGSPLRNGKDWKVVARFDTYDAAYDDAAMRTRLLAIVSM